MRPQGRVYFFDPDPSHFRFVLNYLRNGGHLDVSALPHEERYLLELLAEVKFYNLEGLQEIIRKRLFQITKSKVLGFPLRTRIGNTRFIEIILPVEESGSP